jgi:hypothetical protein
MSFFKTLKGLLAVVVTSAFLVACGGGGGDDPVTGGGGGSSSSLFNAYQAIGPGTTLAQVNALVGYGPNAGTSGFADGSTEYKWSANSGTSLLSVTYRGDGSVELKIYVDGVSTFSQSY